MHILGLGRSRGVSITLAPSPMAKFQNYTTLKRNRRRTADWAHTHDRPCKCEGGRCSNNQFLSGTFFLLSYRLFCGPSFLCLPSQNCACRFVVSAQCFGVRLHPFLLLLLDSSTFVFLPTRGWMYVPLLCAVKAHSQVLMLFGPVPDVSQDMHGSIGTTLLE